MKPKSILRGVVVAFYVAFALLFAFALAIVLKALLQGNVPDAQLAFYYLLSLFAGPLALLAALMHGVHRKWPYLASLVVAGACMLFTYITFWRFYTPTDAARTAFLVAGGLCGVFAAIMLARFHRMRLWRHAGMAALAFVVFQMSFLLLWHSNLPAW